MVLACEILDCCPWFEFAELDVYVSDDDAEGGSTGPESAVPASEDSAATCGPRRAASAHSCEEDTFRGVLARAGLQLPPAQLPTPGVAAEAGRVYVVPRTMA